MAAAHADYTFRHDHLLGIEGLHPLDIAHILDLADTYAEATRTGRRPDPVLTGKTVVNLFFENSTRTQGSFEIAGGAAHRHDGVFVRLRLADGTVFGIISSTTQPFCARCDRSRLTADGTWYLCLYAREGVDLRGPFRAGATPDELRALITGRWQARTDRGAEERLRLRDRAPLLGPGELRADPRLEMHTRGG